MSVGIANGLDSDNEKHVGMLTASTYHHLDQAIGIVPWRTEPTHSSGLSFSPDARFDDLDSNPPVSRMSIANGGPYFNISAVRELELEPSTANHQFPQVPPSAPYGMPFGSAYYLSEDNFISPDDSMVPSTNFQHCAHPSWCASPSLKRPWSVHPLPPPPRLKRPSPSPNQPAVLVTPENLFASVPNHSADQANKLHCGNHAIHRHATDRRPVNPANKTSFSLPSLTEPTWTRTSLSSEDNGSEFPMPEEAEEHQPVVTRHKHNVVEQHYRNRLNHEFDRLLAVLRTGTQKRREEQGKDAGEGERAGDDDDHDDDDYSFGYSDILQHGGRVGEDKRISKAEILRTATGRIRSLEQERGRLRLERKELLQAIEAATMGSGTGNLNVYKSI